MRWNSELLVEVYARAQTTHSSTFRPAKTPQLITEHADIFWGLIASFWIGNVLLVILNVPLIGLWVRAGGSPGAMQKGEISSFARLLVAKGAGTKLTPRASSGSQPSNATREASTRTW